jgi:hypothetical protein
MVTSHRPSTYFLWRHVRQSRQWREQFQSIAREEQAGHPLPLLFDPQTSPMRLQHSAILHDFAHFTGKTFADFTAINEFGGGFGGMCRLIHRLDFTGIYRIFDFPEVSALQEYYLSSVGIKSRQPNAQNEIELISDILEFTRKPSPADLFIGSWSLSEAPQQVRAQIEPMLSVTDNVLICYQPQFEGVDNRKWAQRLEAEDQLSRRWHHSPIPWSPHNWYCFAWKP